MKFPTRQHGPGIIDVENVVYTANEGGLYAIPITTFYQNQKRLCILMGT